MEINLRKSKVLEKIQKNKVATCIKLNIADPRNAEIAAISGFDSIWIDYEHGPNNTLTIENIARATKLHNSDLMVRVAKGSYNDFIKPLEADATSIMIPHVMSLEEAEKIVYYTKFAPIGRRPIDGGNADGAYGLISPEKYVSYSNTEKFVAIQIEDPEPMRDLDKICALNGIDMIFFGPADFLQGLGAPGDFSNTKMLKAKELVAKTARKYNKIAGTVGSSANQNQLIDMGYNFINLGADVTILYDNYFKILKDCSDKDIKI